jgi:hypothetical protein
MLSREDLKAGMEAQRNKTHAAYED